MVVHRGLNSVETMLKIRYEISYNNILPIEWTRETIEQCSERLVQARQVIIEN